MKKLILIIFLIVTQVIANGDLFHVRHILVKDKENANLIIKELNRTPKSKIEKKFISLAKKKSVGPSAVRGGDLGYLNLHKMPLSFREAVVSLEPGEYTKKPVKTKFGYHIIYLVDKKNNESKTSSHLVDKKNNESKTSKAISINTLKKKRGLAWCSSYVIGPYVVMDCTGDVNGKTTPYNLYHAGWKRITPIPGANKFILIFSK